MTDLAEQFNERLFERYLAVAKRGCRRFDFLGGRRSGKSYLIEQLLLRRAVVFGEVVSVAAMTGEQGRLGCYADFCDILAESPSWASKVEVLKSPRQINSIYNRGRIFFNSYQDPERAKGIACDWLYINEANNFTERQYIDLSASVRKGIFADRNPNTKCWTETNGFTLIHSTWRDNDYLTDEQRQWFLRLKEKAESPTATEADKAFYRMYYLGEYAEISGAIFTPANCRRCEELPDGLRCWQVFCDPSALRGNDYTACVLTATDGARVYVVDAISENNGGQSMRVEIVRRLRKWCERYDVGNIYVETNGEVGVSFYEYLIASELNAMGWYSKGNKFQRIIANYLELTRSVVWMQNESVDNYLQQVFAFSESCEHDDNIDAANSAYLAYKWNGQITIEA